MILAFTQWRMMESLTVSSTTKPLALTRKSLATTTLLTKEHPLRKIFTAFTANWKWLEQQEECQAVFKTCAKVSDKNASLGLNQKKTLDFFS
ncbi:hypothetical protein AVEN_3139-1 [Araneus ventricosus]|uniref:Uncharacterized protein n=1 Tax=Araneus ventricosus TaxID=182803 RepID=A0A4Y2JU54_ARAVE|nr:hypothetical protein AVEN_3139-1 [Araneus ventricosus]